MRQQRHIDILYQERIFISSMSAVSDAHVARLMKCCARSAVAFISGHDSGSATAIMHSYWQTRRNARRLRFRAPSPTLTKPGLRAMAKA